MPKINLKPNSPEFIDEKDKNKKKQLCEMPGCSDDANFKAPKDRNLQDYYHFCMEHVQEYNRAWDYFEGMSSIDVEEHIRRAMYGDRPTWRYTSYAHFEQTAKEEAWRFYSGSDESETRENNYSQIKTDTPEFQAMAIMELEPPLNLEKIKTQYKKLVKLYHPDINQDNPNAEELLKNINMAYTILKIACEKYEKLDVQDSE